MSQEGKSAASKNILKPARFGAGKPESGNTAVLAPSKLAGNPFLSKLGSSDDSETPSAGIIRPSVFGGSNATPSSDNNSTENSGQKPELLKPATLHNPFIAAESAHSNGHGVQTSESTAAESTSYFTQFATASASSKTSEKSDDSGSGGFVFGQNLENRVTKGEDSPSETPEEKSESSAPTKDGEDSVAADAKSPETDASSTPASPNGTEQSGSKHMTLKESAEAYQARHKQQTYEEVEVVTGEEEESNVLKVSCCLYVFDKRNQTWTERGRGLLHLNDMRPDSEDQLQSRLVMRLQGSMKVVLNAALWPDMMIERAGDRSVRITAPDPDGEVRILLIKANLGQAEQLYLAIHTRVLQLKAAEPSDSNSADAKSTSASVLDKESTGDSSSPPRSAAGQKRAAEADTEDQSKKPRS